MPRYPYNRIGSDWTVTWEPLTPAWTARFITLTPGVSDERPDRSLIVVHNPGTVDVAVRAQNVVQSLAAVGNVFATIASFMVLEGATMALHVDGWMATEQARIMLLNEKLVVPTASAAAHCRLYALAGV